MASKSIWQHVRQRGWLNGLINDYMRWVASIIASSSLPTFRCKLKCLCSIKHADEWRRLSSGQRSKFKVWIWSCRFVDHKVSHLLTSYLCIRSTPWTCSSVRCGLMSGWNLRAPLKSCAWTTVWWTRSGHQTPSSETPRSPFPITWPHPISSSVSWRMGLSSTPWGDTIQYSY